MTMDIFFGLEMPFFVRLCLVRCFGGNAIDTSHFSKVLFPPVNTMKHVFFIHLSYTNKLAKKKKNVHLPLSFYRHCTLIDAIMRNTSISLLCSDRYSYLILAIKKNLKQL
jgi:hypothetical protein